MSKLRCLLIRQPYASLIAFGRKRWEFRSQDTKIRGVIGIAASPNPPLRTFNEQLNSILHLLPQGLLLATARLSSSFYVTGADLAKNLTTPVTVNLHGHSIVTSDQPLGEPLEDIQLAAKNAEWESFAWLLEDVRPVSDRIRISKSGASTWTIVERSDVNETTE
jgi:hypothetical protein